MSPHRLPTPCPAPGCPALTPPGTRCKKHAREKRNEKAKNEGSAASRGYGSKWRRVRALVLRQAGGLCQRCKARGRTRRATQVHHIDHDPTGPERLNPDNLEPLCDDCHYQRHREARRKG